MPPTTLKHQRGGGCPAPLPPPLPLPRCATALNVHPRPCIPCAALPQIILYHIHPDEALTEAELVYTAARGGNLTTALPGHDLGVSSASGVEQAAQPR